MRILLADDHPLFADALRTLIERNLQPAGLTVVGSITATHRALTAGPRYDLAILDLHMPDGNGFEGIKDTLERFKDTPIVVISGAASAGDVRRALQLGARGFLPKTLPSKALAAALQVIISGGTYVPAEYAEESEPAPPASPAPAGLTPRESEVLKLLTVGRANKEIGRELGLQEITIKLHVRNIFRKLGVRNRVEAANAARRLGYEPKQ
jgi:two-component system nitrate/nitrite response regulator NarL